MSTSVSGQHPAAVASAVRKATARLIPFLFICYIVAFIDRVNISFAALRMNKDIGLSDAVFGLGSGIFFIGYFIFEVPSNLLLAKFGARKWISRIMITWGILSACMMFVRGPMSFYIVRFLLGAAEAGFFPGIILYLASWFPQRERARATALFMSAIPLSGLIGAPLSGWLLGMHPPFGLKGWQFLFVVEAIPALIVGVLVLFLLPDHPRAVRWLSDEESDGLTAVLADEEATTAQRKNSHSLAAGLASPLVWLLGLAYFGTVTSLLGLSFWLPTMVKKISGQGDFMTSLISALPYLFGAIAMVLIASHSDRTQERRFHTAIPALVAGVSLVASAYAGIPWLSIALLCLVSAGIYGCNGTFWSVPTARLTGTAAAAGLALINSIGNLGGFVGPFVLGYVRQTTGSDRLGLLFLASLAFMSAIILFAVARRTGPATSLDNEGSVNHD